MAASQSTIHNAVKRWSGSRLMFTLLVCAGGWAIVALACVCVGSTSQLFRWPGSWDQLQSRGEVVLLASLIGAALAAAGVVYQAILRNPLADPYLLGVSSGAMLSTYLWQLPWATQWIHTG